VDHSEFEGEQIKPISISDPARIVLAEGGSFRKMVAAPKRRWFRFSLRTMFVVVTITCGWLSYEANWIRQRRMVIADPQVQSATYHDSETVRIVGSGRQVLRRHVYTIAPWPLRWLGEVGYFGIALEKGASEDEVARVRGLFPEAEMVVVYEP
jgi:hypothetical protein